VGAPLVVVAHSKWSDTRTSAGGSAQPPLPRLKFSPLVWVLAAGSVVLLAVAIVVAAQRGERVGVLVAKQPLPRNHRLTGADIRVESRRRRDAQDRATLPLEGRLVTRSVREGAVLHRADIGPSLTGLGSSPRIVGVPANRAGVLGGTLRPGDRIILLVGRRGKAAAHVRALVVSASRDDSTSARPWALVVALNENDADTYAYRLAQSGAIVVRDANATR
jgi:hypothetical protein